MNFSTHRFRARAVRFAANPSAWAAGVSLTIKLVSSALNIVMLTIIARHTSAAEFGRFALSFNAVSLLAVIAGAGQERLILRSWNEYLAGKRYDLARGALIFGVGVSFAAPVILAAVLLPAAFLTDGTIPAASALVLLVVLTLYIFALHLNRALVGLVAGDGHEITWRVIVIAAVLMLGGAGRLIEAETVLWLFSAGMAAALLCQVVTASVWLPAEIRSVPARTLLKLWMLRSVKLASGSILEAAQQSLEVVLIGVLIDPVAAGGYFVASRIANAFSMISGGLNSYATRQISSDYYERGALGLVHVVRTVAIVSAVLVAAGAVLIATAGTQILALFGAGYVEQYPVLILLCIGTAAGALAGPAPSLLVLTGREGTYSVIIAIMLALRLVALVVLARWFGAVGVAVASAGSSICTAVVLNLACRRLIGVDPAVSALLVARKRADDLGYPSQNPGGS